MRAVMYHYVREHDSNYPNFRFLDVGDFRKQLDFFQSEYGFLTREEWDSYIFHGTMPEHDGKVLLTFDDAMYCHYDYVFPELVKRGLWGIFYVPTLPYLEKKLLDVHRIHLLCGAFDGRDLLSVTSQNVSEEMIPFEKREEFRNQTYSRQKNYEGVSEFKRILNYFISNDYRSSMIDVVARSFSYKFSPSRFYVSEQALQEMSKQGMIIGSHTHSHSVMSKLSRQDQNEELSKSFEFLEPYYDSNHKTYCHPYGGFHSFNEDTVRLLNEHSVTYSFNVEDRQMNHLDRINSRQHLPRYDCNLFPHGKAS